MRRNEGRTVHDPIRPACMHFRQHLAYSCISKTIGVLPAALCTMGPWQACALQPGLMVLLKQPSRLFGRKGGEACRSLRPPKT